MGSTAASRRAWQQPYRKRPDILLRASDPTASEFVADQAKIPEQQPGVQERKDVQRIQARRWLMDMQAESATRHQAEPVGLLRSGCERAPICEKRNKEMRSSMYVQVPWSAKRIPAGELLSIFQL